MTCSLILQHKSKTQFLKSPKTSLSNELALSRVALIRTLRYTTFIKEWFDCLLAYKHALKPQMF